MADKAKCLRYSRSATEQLQIAIKEYKGKSYLDMRIFIQPMTVLRGFRLKRSYLFT